MRKLLIFLLILIFLFFLYCFFVRKGGCCISSKISPVDSPQTVEHWINWNILFTTGSITNSGQMIQQFEDSLNKYVKGYNPSASLSFKYHHCPCDTLLTNMDATLAYGSGNSVPPPPVKPSPGPKGDYTLGNNFNMYIPSYLDSNRFDTSNMKKYNVRMDVQFGSPVIGTTVTKTKNNVLAVIDTGLDSVLFNYSFPQTVWAGNLLWQDPAKPTLFDVVIDETTGTLKDGTPGVSGNPVKHGTAATEIALTQIFSLDRKRIPQIMSIRAFDDSEKGSIYTVSCAMSYAIQKKADYINASWGYFGQEDPVLKNYISKANNNEIRIIAAAGNTPGKHDPSKVCSTNTANPVNNLDMLNQMDTILFYPACFAPEFKNLVSVTQVDLTSSMLVPQPPALKNLFPCFYQNYSSNYITLGALEPPTTANANECCTFKIPFLDQNIEGSSFATPAMTAHFMASMANDQDIKSWIRSNAPSMLSKKYTEGGYYFTFHQLP
jgi:Subtilase family